MNVFLVDFENVNSSGLNGVQRLEPGDQVVIFYSENADSMTFDLHEQINNSRAYIFFQKVEVGRKNALDFQLSSYLGYLICQNEMAGNEVSYYVVTKDRGYSSMVNYWAKRGFDVKQIGSLSSSKIEWDGAPETGEKPESESFGASEEIEAAPVESESGETSKEKEKEEKKGKGKSSSKSGGSKKHKDGGEKKDKPAEEKKSGGEKEEEKKPEEKKPKSGGKGRRKKEETPEQKELRIQVESAVPDKDVVDLVVSYIQKYKTKLGINNALAKEFKDSKKASEIYKSIKPLIADKKGQ